MDIRLSQYMSQNHGFYLPLRTNISDWLNSAILDDC